MTDEEKAGSPLRNRRDEAIGWWLRGKDRPLSPEDQTAFETWLARDPANKAAFDDISDMCEHFMGMRPRAAPLSSPAMRRFWLGGAAAFAATSLAFFLFRRNIGVPTVGLRNRHRRNKAPDARGRITCRTQCQISDRGSLQRRPAAANPSCGGSMLRCLTRSGAALRRRGRRRDDYGTWYGPRRCAGNKRSACDRHGTSCRCRKRW